MQRISFLAAAAILVLTASQFVQAQSGQGSRVAEATIFEDQPGSNGGSYGDICVGNLMTGSMTRRGLVRFDLPAIPDGSTVIRVSLALQQDRVRFQGEGRKSATIEARRITSAWTEGNGGGSQRACGGGSAQSGVTWDQQPGFQSTPSATLAVGTDNGFNFVLDSAAGATGLVDDVQAWVNGDANNGWLISVAEESDPDNARLLEIGALNIEWETSADSDFVINSGLNDAWFNPDTAGQGFFFNVFPDQGLFFLSWFTFDTERPPEDVTAILGEPGHRWITAQGSFSGNVATLDATLTSGGVFDSPVPQVVNDAYGTVTVTFDGCNAATVDYNFPDPGVSGSVPVQRVVPDNVALCEALAEGDAAR